MTDQNGTFKDPRIEIVLDTLMQLAWGNLKARVPLSEGRDEIEAVMVGINMLAEELEARSSELATAQTYAEQLIRSMPDGLWVVDADGTTLDVNPALLNLLRYGDRENLLKRRLCDIIVEPEGPRVEQALADALEGTPGAFETAVTTREGATVPVLLTLMPRTLGWQRLGAFAILRDVTERQRFEQSIVDSRNRLRSLAVRLADTEEVSRQRLARELHDQVGQRISVLGMNLNHLRNRRRVKEDDRDEAHVENALQLVGEIARTIQDVMFELRPAVLDDLGVTAALRWYAAKFQKQTGVETRWLCCDEAPRFSGGTEIAVLRIFQEALANVAKHARTDSVQLSLEMGPRLLRIAVRDKGRGFQVCGNAAENPSERRSWGLDIMRERAHAMGAALSIESTPLEGTSVILDLDIPHSLRTVHPGEPS